MDRTLHKRPLFGVAIVVWCFIAAVLHARTFTAALKGRVVDSSGGAILTAKITIRNVATNWQQTVTVGEERNFVLALLPPGEYALTVEASGFRKEVRAGDGSACASP